MNLDIIAGKVDAQGQFLRIDDYPLFKENEAKGNYNAIPVHAWQHHMLIYWLNPLVKDTNWSKALSNPEFRKALSIALDRKQINEALFKGLGEPAQFAPPKDTPLYDTKLSQFAAEYNPKEAAAILDKLGYKDTNNDKIREFPDGSPMVLPLSFYEVTPAAVPGVKMATQYWGDIGIKVEGKMMEGSTFYQFAGANELPVSVHWANGPDLQDGSFVSMRSPGPTVGPVVQQPGHKRRGTSASGETHLGDPGQARAGRHNRRAHEAGQGSLAAPGRSAHHPRHGGGSEEPADSE